VQGKQPFDKSKTRRDLDNLCYEDDLKSETGLA
jgi:hypothetical protein